MYPSSFFHIFLVRFCSYSTRSSRELWTGIRWTSLRSSKWVGKWKKSRTAITLLNWAINWNFLSSELVVKIFTTKRKNWCSVSVLLVNNLLRVLIYFRLLLYHIWYIILYNNLTAWTTCPAIWQFVWSMRVFTILHQPVCTITWLEIVSPLRSLLSNLQWARICCLGIENIVVELCSVFYKALVWQMMRAYTLKILQNLAQSDKPLEDKEIIAWVNEKVCNSYNHALRWNGEYHTNHACSCQLPL